MSSMAKIFVVVNLIIAIAAFGSAATLLGAQDDYKTELLKTIDQAKKTGEAKDAENKRLNDELTAQTTTASNAVQRATQAETDNQAKATQLQEHKSTNDKLVATAEKQSQELGSLRAVLEQYKDWLKNYSEESRSATQDKINFQKRWEEEVANRVRLEEEVKKLQEEVEGLAGDKNDAEKALRNAEFMLGEYRKRYGPMQAGKGAPGRVLQVRGSLVSLSVGSGDGVKTGDVYQLRRGGTYVGQVRVTRVYKDQSVGEFDTQFTGPGAPPQVNDQAESRNY
ncbi:MAG: hypothetical protein ACYSX0_06635 [Planctomycetota bacterium]|jgi:hypothetical protein